jgi:hypothetical protein
LKNFVDGKKEGSIINSSIPSIERNENTKMIKKIKYLSIIGPVLEAIKAQLNLLQL